MKFSCNKCDTKYSIADEKVRGKVLKIRCKKCENIIVLREPKAEEPRGEEPTRAVALDPATLAQLRSAMADPAPAPAAQARQTTSPGGAVLRKQAPVEREEPTRAVGLGEMDEMLKRAQSSTGPQRPATDGSAALRTATPQPQPLQSQSADWFLAIKGQQIGPLTQAQVAQRITSGEADDRTYAWKDGMGDWKRIADIPELKSRPMPPPPPPAPPPPPPSQGAQVVDLQAEIARRKKNTSEEMPLPAQDPEPAPAASDPLAAMMAEQEPDNSPFAGAAPITDHAQDPFAAVPDSAAAADGPPRESTRMFIAAAGLENRGKKHTMYAIVGVLVFAGLGTLLTLDAMGIVTIPIAHDFVNYSFEALNIEQPVARKERIEAEDMDVSALTRKKQEEKRRQGGGRKQGGGDEGVDLAAALQNAQAGGGVELGTRKGGEDGVDVKAPTSDSAASLELKKALEANGKRTVDVQLKQATPVENKGPGVQGGNMDVPLKPEQIAKVVGDQKASLSQCAQDAAKAGEKFKGSVNVTVTIGPSGKVQRVVVNEQKMRETVLGQCIGRALMRWIFPAFKGEPFDAELPLKMSVGP